MKWSYLTSVAAAALLSGSAFAADVDLANTKAPPAPPPSWWDTVAVTGYLEGSETGNFANPYNGLNWGRLFDDRADGPMFNQGLLTVQRPLDPKATDYDFGFKVQGMVGEDARYTHFLGELDYAIDSLYSARCRRSSCARPSALGHPVQPRRHRREVGPVCDAAGRGSHLGAGQPVLLA